MRMITGFFRLFLIVFLAGGVLSGCAGGLDYAPTIEEKQVVYTLAPGDILDISVVDEDNLSGEYIVDDQGYIEMPFVGRLNVTGMTAEQADMMLSEFYSNGYLANPDLSIKIKTYRPFYILGEVESPGRYDYVDGLTILNAVATAGGFTYRADQKDFEIVRKLGSPADVPQKLVDRKLSASVLPGDTIYVKERLF